MREREKEINMTHGAHETIGYEIFSTVLLLKQDRTRGVVATNL